MKRIFAFGERMDEYAVPVLNEREVRASAGILFACAMIAFMNAWLAGNFRPTKIFVIAFLIDFTIRIFVNPKYSPTMILGRFAVRHQAPEYVGAPQKRFAWAIGFLLALSMLYLIVINNVVGPINMIVCATCLILMFFESAFGICLGCKIYNLFSKQQAQLCPGGTCEADERREIQKISFAHALIVVAFLACIGFVSQRLLPPAEAVAVSGPVRPSPSDGKCTPPDWAVAMGHGEMWKLHNNCR